MTELNFFREKIIRKKKDALDKINYFRVDFMRKEKETREDLEEAGRIWKEVSRKFKWWQSLP